MDEFQRANATYFKFTVVRHPMDRLLSCYVDKLLNNGQYYYNFSSAAYSESIPYRVKIRAREIMMKRVSSTQQATDAKATLLLSSSSTADNDLFVMPTFEEFLEFVLSTHHFYAFEGIAVHWAPYYRYCTPCSGMQI
jgi:hypothetical protein